MAMITDWLMVIITAIYVFATIFICMANIKTAKLSKRQMEEMKRQFEEENRPNIEVEFLYEKRTFYGLRFINNGKYTANNTCIEFDSAFLDSIKEYSFSEMLYNQKGKMCVIGKGQHYDLFFGSNKYRENPDKVPAIGIVRYEANGIKYQSEFNIDLEHYATIFSLENEQEEVEKKLNEINSQLKEIEMAISRVASSLELKSVNK